MPALLVAVEDEALGELGVPRADLLGELVGAREAGLLGAVRRVEEADAGGALLVGLERDGLREVEVLVVHPLGALLERLEPPGRRALRRDPDEGGRRGSQRAHGERMLPKREAGGQTEADKMAP